MNSLLDPLHLPNFADLTPEAIGAALDEGLAAYQAVVRDLIEMRPTSFEEVWLPLERADVAVSALWSSVSHLHSVADTPELRKAYALGEARMVEVVTAVRQMPELYSLLVDLSTSADFAKCPAADRVAVEHEIRNFTLSGVALADEARSRFAAVSLELSKLSTAFSSAVLDATEAWFEPIEDAAHLAGIPEGAMAMFAAAAAARGLKGWVVTLQAPSVIAVLTFAENRDLRERVYRAYGTRASEAGPDAGRFDNSERIEKILALRQERAELLGMASAVDLSLATKMAPDGAEVLRFLRDLAVRARPSAEKDLAALEAHGRTLGLETLEAWDRGFVSERLRAERYAVQEEEIRAYFPVGRVMEGWQQLLLRLYGVRLQPRVDVALWHEDARYFDVADDQGRVFAGVYLDLHARTGKRGGAWMAEARPRLRDGDAVSLPVAYLSCNFAPKDENGVSLLSHDDVVTFLHETGHGLHLLFTEVDRPSIGGVNGFEWDAVELPSQMMEDFAWDRTTLKEMSGHKLTGDALPDGLFDKMVAARHFQSGLGILRQVEFAMFDLILHMGIWGRDPMVVLKRVREEVAVVSYPEWHRFPHSFNHIFSGGYAAGYYSYLWAEVLAADAFRKFAEAGVVDRATGDAFRREVLSRGASRPVAESFRGFRGRDPDPVAMLVRHGLAA